MHRSSPPEVFLGNGVVKMWSKFKGEHVGRSVISIKLLCNFIEITLCHGCSPANFLHIAWTPFHKNTSGGLLQDKRWTWHLVIIANNKRVFLENEDYFLQIFTNSTKIKPLEAHIFIIDDTPYQGVRNVSFLENFEYVLNEWSHVVKLRKSPEIEKHLSFQKEPPGDVLLGSCFLKFTSKHQAWILPPDIGQCPTKNRVKSNESCFTMDTVVLREVKTNFLRYRCPKSQKHPVSIGLCCSAFSLYVHFKRQFTHVIFLMFKTVRCISIKTFYTNTTNTLLGFFVLHGAAALLKIFYMSLHSTKSLKDM